MHVVVDLLLLLWVAVLVLRVVGAAEPDVSSGGGCGGFLDVAVHRLELEADPQLETRKFCEARGVPSCDVLWASARANFYTAKGLQRVVSAAGDSTYEYGPPTAKTVALEVSIDRRVAVEVNGTRYLVGPQTNTSEFGDVRREVARVKDDLCSSLKGPQQVLDSQARDEAIAALATCDRLFLDLGAHDGSTLRSFFHPDDTGLGNWAKHHVEDPSKFCGLGIEPSPDLAAPLQATVASLTNVVALVGFAASDTAGGAPLFFGTDSQVGNSLRFEAPDVFLHGSIRSTDVRTLRIPPLLTTLVPAHHLVIKMDIEGAEFLVLRDLLASGVLCNLVDESVHVDLLLEEHRYLRDFFDPDAPIDALATYVYVLRRCGVSVFVDEHHGRGGVTD